MRAVFTIGKTIVFHGTLSSEAVLEVVSDGVSDGVSEGVSEGVSGGVSIGSSTVGSAVDASEELSFDEVTLLLVREELSEEVVFLEEVLFLEVVDL